MATRTKAILARLAKDGVVGTFVSDMREDADGEIRITPTVSVQVGWDYAIVCLADSATNLTAIRQYPARSDSDLSYLAGDIEVAKVFDFNAKPVYERVDASWEVQVYAGPNGGSIIERWRGAKNLKPIMWLNDNPPEVFVSMQRDKAKYVKVAATPKA